MPEKGTITIYGHESSPAVAGTLGILMSAKARFQYINIHEDQKAADKVRSINHGTESVPTIVFPDGSILTQPTAMQLRVKLKELGYKNTVQTFLQQNAVTLIMLLILILAFLWYGGVFNF